ncbi:MAG TPA: nuclear transport factor 2 family protein [Vicinamibacterales bacterium]|nr:nuclear transport factor 2 family protein [Vicinamibacterales bacterium]
MAVSLCVFVDDFRERRRHPCGDSAVASYLLHVKTQSKSGVSDDTYQETDVWFKRDGAWRVVFLHYSAAAPRRPQPQ